MTPLLDKKEIHLGVWICLFVCLFVEERGPLEVKSIAVLLFDKIVKCCAIVRRYDCFKVLFLSIRLSSLFLEIGGIRLKFPGALRLYDSCNSLVISSLKRQKAMVSNQQPLLWFPPLRFSRLVQWILRFYKTDSNLVAGSGGSFKIRSRLLNKTRWRCNKEVNPRRRKDGGDCSSCLQNLEAISERQISTITSQAWG